MVYQFDGLPPIVVVRTDRELMIGTQGAVTAALGAGEVEDRSPRIRHSLPWSRG